MRKIKTVLGDITETGTTLAHEHICCYSEYLYKMLGDSYLNKENLTDSAVSYLKELKKKYGLNTFIDCTPINIGRDVELLKSVAQKSGVNIVCSTGFYYADEPILYNTSVEDLSEYIIADALNVNAGIIKCAVESETISPYIEKVLRACAKTQLKLDIPIVMHTNAKNKNGIKGLEILLSEGVKPQAITVGHLSDTEDIEYIKYFAKCGCFVGFDRLYENHSDEYVESKAKAVMELVAEGYGEQILLSHDALYFNGFEQKPQIYSQPRFNYCFDYILPKLPKDIVIKIMTDNVLKMLKCGD